MSRSGGFLLVRAGDRRLGLPVGEIVEVVELGATYPVPAREPAMRGVGMVRGRLLPVVHLGALLDDGPCPPTPGVAGVVVRVGGRAVCLEVDGAEAVAPIGRLLTEGAALPWAAGVARTPDGLIPLLDLGALGARFAEVHER